MHEEAPTADVVGQLDEAGEHILEQPGAEASPFMACIHAEPSEQRHRLGKRPAPGEAVLAPRSS